jgi:hypothetical protein
MVAECARVLKPEGVLIALFLLATVPIEGQGLMPSVHWLPSGSNRHVYIRFFLTVGVGSKLDRGGLPRRLGNWANVLRNIPSIAL